LCAAAAAAAAGGSLDEEFAPALQLQEGQPLPGIPTTWAVNQSVPEVNMQQQQQQQQQQTYLEQL
jgi:hypothetical protein